MKMNIENKTTLNLAIKHYRAEIKNLTLLKLTLLNSGVDNVEKVDQALSEVVEKKEFYVDKIRRHEPTSSEKRRLSNRMSRGKTLEE